METDYFVSNFFYENEMVVDYLDNDKNYKNCVNLGKAASFVNALDFQQYDASNYSMIKKKCERVYRSRRYDKPDKSMDVRDYCKGIAGDDDFGYVTCLEQNGVRHRVRQKKKVAAPETRFDDKPNDGFVVEEKIFPPNMTTFSCRDTVEGFCRENLTLNECISLCDAHEDCSYGYHVRDGKRSFCYPLSENVYNLKEKNCLRFLSYDASEFRFPRAIRGNIFYKKTLRLTGDPNPRIGVYKFCHGDTYLQDDCSFGSQETAIAISFVNIDQENYLPVNYQNYFVINRETLHVLVYDLSGKRFMFTPGLIAKDNNFIGINDNNLISFFTCSLQNDKIRLFFISDKIDYLSVRGNRLGLNADPTSFRLENGKTAVFPRIPVSSFEPYYEQFVRPPKKKTTVFIVASICMLAAILLLCYICL